MPSQTSDLTIAVQEPSAWSRRIAITVPADRVHRLRSEVTRQLARNARLPGFRKGKMPVNLIERQFAASIDQETIDRTIQEAYREALESEGLSPITQGAVDRVEYQKGEALSFEVQLEIRPEITIERSNGFRVERPSLEVNEDDVGQVLERLRDERAEWEPLPEGEKPVEGQRVTVDIVSLEPEEGEETDPRSYRFVIGEGQAIPSIEEAITSLAPGEEGDFDVRFPDDFDDVERQGQQQRLHIHLTGASRKILPELTDEFAAGLGDFETVEALRTRILEDLKADAEQRAEAEVRGQLVDRILEANPFEVPGSMIERYLDEMTGHSHHGDHDHQHTPEEEEQIERARTGLRPQAEWSIKRLLIIEALADAEGLRATQDDIDERVEKLAEQHERTATEVWLQLEKAGQLDALEREITEEKVFQHLLAQNEVA